MKAMVLCAGYGTRLGRLVEETPKPMLRLGERPMLEYILRNLARHGFDEVAVNLHFRPEVIRDYLGDGSRLGIRLVYSEEPELLGTAGGVKKMAAFFAGEPFLVHYGDVVTNQDFGAMFRFHRDRGALATLLVHQRARSNSVIGLDDEHRIVAFLERPDESQRQTLVSPWANSGIAICEAELIEAIPDGRACDLPRDVYSNLIGSRRLLAFPLTGFRCAVDSPDRLEEARRAAAAGTIG
jgi:mannose-1-phosphate guanylyltransferase/phosphomannomutase